MKKLFSLVAAVLFAGSMMADAVVFDGTENTSTGFTKGDVTVSFATDTYTWKDDASNVSGFAGFWTGAANPKVDASTNYTAESTSAPTIGSVMHLTPASNGTMIVYVVVNGSKPIYVHEDNAPINFTIGEDEYTPASTLTAKYYGAMSFPVTAGSTYSAFCTGSKMGFYGYELIADKPTGPVEEINYWLVGTAAENGWDQTNAMPMPGDSIVRHLAAGTYEFKVLTQEASWTGALGYANLNAEASSANVFGSDNVCFELENEGDATIKVVDGQIVVLGNFKEQVSYDYYVKFAGNNWTWVGMTQAPSGVYMYEGVWGGTGANVNTQQNDNGATWYPEANIFFSTEEMEPLPVPALGTVGYYTYIPDAEPAAMLYFLYEGEPEPELDTFFISSAEIVAGKVGNIALGNNTYGSQDVAKPATWYTCEKGNYTFKGAKVCVATDANGGGIQFQGNASDATKMGFFGNANAFKNIHSLKIVARVVTTNANHPNFHVYTDSLGTTNAIAPLDTVMTTVGGFRKYVYTFNYAEAGKFFNIKNDLVGALYIDSIYVTAEKTPAPAVEAPEFDIPAGSYYDPQTIHLSSATEGAVFFYTTDGTEPTSASTLYYPQYGIYLAAGTNVTIKAVAYNQDTEEYSKVVTKEYEIANAYNSFDSLVLKAGTPASQKVVVNFSNVVIDSLYTNSSSKVKGVYLTAAGRMVEIYTAAAEVPATWAAGGIISGTVKGEWKEYKSTWEVCPDNWEGITYTAPMGFEVEAGTTTFTVTPSDLEVEYYISVIPSVNEDSVPYTKEVLVTLIDGIIDDMGAGLEYFSGIQTQSYEEDWYVDEPGDYLILVCAVNAGHNARTSDLVITPFTFGPTTAIEAVKDAKATKALVNGKVMIIRNGARYNVAGQLVK